MPPLPASPPIGGEEKKKGIKKVLRRARKSLNRAGVLQAHDLLVLGHGLAFDGEALAVAPVGLDGPQQNRIATEKSGSEALAVAGAPQILPGQRAPDRAPQQPPHHQRKRQVEPDQRIGGAPREIAHLAVVSDHDPVAVSGLALDPMTEQLERRGLPVAAPEQ